MEGRKEVWVGDTTNVCNHRLLHGRKYEYRTGNNFKPSAVNFCPPPLSGESCDVSNVEMCIRWMSRGNPLHIYYNHQHVKPVPCALRDLSSFFPLHWGKATPLAFTVVQLCNRHCLPHCFLFDQDHAETTEQKSMKLGGGGGEAE